MSVGGPTRSSWELQLARAAGAAVAMSPHSFSSLMPGVVEERQESVPDRLGALLICGDSMVSGGTWSRVDQFSAGRVPVRGKMSIF